MVNMTARSTVWFSVTAMLLLLAARIGCGLAGTVSLGATSELSDVSPVATVISPTVWN
jgi:hypothetical protein